MMKNGRTKLWNYTKKAIYTKIQSDTLWPRTLYAPKALSLPSGRCAKFPPVSSHTIFFLCVRLASKANSVRTRQERRVIAISGKRNHYYTLF